MNVVVDVSKERDYEVVLDLVFDDYFVSVVGDFLRLRSAHSVNEHFFSWVRSHELSPSGDNLLVGVLSAPRLDLCLLHCWLSFLNRLLYTPENWCSDVSALDGLRWRRRR